MGRSSYAFNFLGLIQFLDTNRYSVVLLGFEMCLISNTRQISSLLGVLIRFSLIGIVSLDFLWVQSDFSMPISFLFFLFVIRV